MYQVNFKVKDLDGFSFSVEQMGKVLRPDAQQSNGDTLDTVAACLNCGALDKVGNMADGITVNGGLTFRYVCGKCNDSPLFNDDYAGCNDAPQHDTELPADRVMNAFILADELDIKTSPNRYHPGTPPRFHQRHNPLPGGVDEYDNTGDLVGGDFFDWANWATNRPGEDQSGPFRRVDLGLHVFAPCGVCAGQGEIVSFTGKNGLPCLACSGKGETATVVSLNAVLAAQGVSFDAEKAMITAFELSKVAPF